MKATDNGITSSKQKILATVLSPLHVGSGDSLHQNLDWLYDKETKTVVFLDDVRVFKIMGTQLLDTWVDRISINRKEDLLEFLKAQKKIVELKDLEKNRAALFPPYEAPKKEIFSMIRNGHGNPLIPGSSLKGSLRTAYFNFLLRQHPNLPASNLYDPRNYKDKGLSNALFAPRAERGKAPNYDSFKLLQISDFTFKKTAIGAVDVISATGDANCDLRQDLQNFAEWISAGSQALGFIRLDTERPQLAKKYSQRNTFADSIPESISQLMEIANNHTIKHLEEEINFAERLDLPQGVLPLPENLKALLAEAQNCEKGECVIHTGMGVGYKGITGNWVKDYLPVQEQKKLAAKVREKPRQKTTDDRLPFPRSRKLAPEGWPPGYLKLSVLTAGKEAALKNEALRIEKEKIEKEQQALKEAQEAEERRKHEEEQAKKPQFYTGQTIKEMQSELEAVISYVNSKPYKAKVYLREPEIQEIEFVGYNNPPLHETVMVYPAQITKKGVIKQVKFKAFKNK